MPGGASCQEKRFQLPRNFLVDRFCQNRTTNRHRWTGISVPRRARKPSLRNSAIQLDVPLVYVLPNQLHDWDSVNNAGRLFNKNTGLCKVERRCIGADTCPVLVGQSFSMIESFGIHEWRT